MTIWQLLETEPTKDKTAIKKAFAAQVKKHKPSDDAELYQLLREAYNAALAFADSDEEIEEEPEEPEETSDAEEAENEERDDSPIIDKKTFFESIIKEIEETELDESDDEIDDEIDETNIDDADIEETEINESEIDSDSKLDEYERIFSAGSEESSPYDKNLFEKKTFALEDKLDYFEIVKLETSDEEKKLAIESGKNEKTKRTLIFFIAILVLICRCIMH